MLKRSASSRVFIDTLKIIFIVSLFIETYGQNRIYVFVPDTVTQPEAKQHCRKYYTDLATFRNEDDIDALPNECHFGVFCWIGLQRKINDTVWKWSDGDKTNFTHWELLQPDNFGGQKNCVVIQGSFWYDTSCDDKRPFLCYEDEPILVQENKTWQEALEHCRDLHSYPFSRTNYFKHAYDLLHIRSANLSSAAREAVVNAQTEGVWIGLRFLAGNWLWVNEMPPSNQLPVCPAAGNNCGTVAKTGDVVQLSNCSEKRLFFCSRN
ncbi:Aggrecan core protein Cartilage-specific proteoglycan core protein [Channa argus]|uniref:Aggrecan core protein Cartilage-specific proteoglycan core protein n=1 Tax=Channa argus TaxID=215402 RepID=A0A6G1PA76_CHAAH|nr:Aggrecan core protein Cartilage-specific proteoglycan core protein [Channa argus]